MSSIRDNFTAFRAQALQKTATPETEHIDLDVNRATPMEAQVGAAAGIDAWLNARLAANFESQVVAELRGMGTGPGHTHDRD